MEEIKPNPNVDEQKEENQETKTYTQEEVLKLLQSETDKRVSSYQITLSRNLSKQYHSAFELGDIGTIQDDLLDIEIDFRLTEITEVYESDDFRLEVVCGYDKKDLGSAIKRSTSNTETLLKIEGSGGSSQIDTSQILNLVYPVGSIYATVNNVNPSTFFGGTWVRHETGGRLNYYMWKRTE